MGDSRYLTVEASAQRLGRSTSWVRSRLCEGVLDAKLVSNQWLISVESLDTLELAVLPPEPSQVVHNFLPERSSQKNRRSPNSPKKTKSSPELVRLVRDSTLKGTGPLPKKVLRPAPEKSQKPLPKRAAAAPIEQPPYWDKCRKLDFAQLRRFIDDSLQGPSAPDFDDRPRSKEEFLALWEMLREKSGVSDLAPMLQQLRSFLNRQQRLKGELYAATSNRSGTKRSIKELKSKLERVDHDITWIHAKLQRQRQQAPLRRLKIIERVHGDIEHAFKFESIVPTDRLPWRVLPPGELSVDTVLEHYGRLQRLNPHIRYAEERITKAFSLRPSRCYVGTEEFEGYIILTFADTPRALLECPKYGNAIYVIDLNWKRWSKMTKQELLANRSGEITRIIHRGDWFWRVKQELGVR